MSDRKEKLVKEDDCKNKKPTMTCFLGCICISLLFLTAFEIKTYILNEPRPELKIMKNEMKPKPFEILLKECLNEYREKKSFFGVPVVQNKDLVPIGPAAGPHTQLTGNIIAAYAAGATTFDLKTVQILTGEQLGIIKPCIYVGSEVYNTEWSTELTVKEAMNEYIKAALLIQVLSKEFGLTPFEKVEFIISVGYDLKGIKSESVDSFINGMKNAENTEEWKNDIKIIENMKDQFKVFKVEQTKNFKKDLVNTVTLSTMHGCPAEDIEKIGNYLMTEKKLNTFIKMNPTLLGKNRLDEILKKKGYSVTLPEEVFKSDINMDQAKEIIKNCKETAKKQGRTFGVKLTNTLPARIMHKELAGQNMYMSGPGLYAISLNVASLLSKEFDGDLKIAYSGGIDDTNIKGVLKTGIRPVTLSSYLLKPKGYQNLNKLLVKVDMPEKIKVDYLEELAAEAINDKNTNKKDPKKFKTNPDYSETCAACHNCENVCPNRANRRTIFNGKEVVVHDSTLCNECGACVFQCIKGHVPYKEKANLVYTDKLQIGLFEIICFIGIAIGLILAVYVYCNAKKEKVEKEEDGTELEDQ